jgi:hypothetical protein
MSSPVDGLNRGQARVWLKYVVNSDLLDKLPGQFAGGDSRSYADDLLNELRDLDSAGRPLGEILADVRRFRDWVEARQKRARRVILAEGGPDDGAIDRVLRRRDVEAESRPSRPEPRRPEPQQSARPATPSPSPRSHPLFDDWLDG